MIRAFRSEWVKLRRLSLISGTLGAMAFFVVVSNFFLFRIASLPPAQGPQQNRGPRGGREFLLSQVTGSGGAVRGFAGTAGIISLVVLIVFASNVGNEYKQGTLRFLLAGEPRRLRLLGGKILALASFAVVAVLGTLLIGVAAAFFFSSIFDVDNSRWWSATGLQEVASTYLNVAAAATCWGILGGGLAIALRTSTAAIGVGAVYLLLGEALLGLAARAVVDFGPVWFPGEALEALGSGGTPASSYVRAAMLAAGYLGAAALGAGAAFARRDVVT